MTTFCCSQNTELVGTEKDADTRIEFYHVTLCYQLPAEMKEFSGNVVHAPDFHTDTLRSDTSPSEPGQKSSPLPGCVSSPPRDQADPEAANLHSNDLPTPALQPQVSKSQVQDP